MKPKNFPNRVRARRLVALANLEIAEFTPKTLRNGKERTEADWKKRVKRELAVLRKRTK